MQVLSDTTQPWLTPVARLVAACLSACAARWASSALQLPRHRSPAQPQLYLHSTNVDINRHYSSCRSHPQHQAADVHSTPIACMPHPMGGSQQAQAHTCCYWVLQASYDCAPWVNDQRVAVAFPLLIVLTSLCSCNDKCLAFNCPGPQQQLPVSSTCSDSKRTSQSCCGASAIPCHVPRA
jgi:hypothetical protein